MLGSNTRSFNAVLQRAQEILKKTFGMELVELRSRVALQSEQDVNGQEEVAEARKATGIKKKGMRPPASLILSHIPCLTPL